MQAEEDKHQQEDSRQRTVQTMLFKNQERQEKGEA
jgi:hypothetical protein